MTIKNVPRITWAKWFVVLLKHFCSTFNYVSKNNILAARVELLQVCKVAGETATPFIFNLYSAYLQQLCPCCEKLCFETLFILHHGKRQETWTF